MKSFWNDLLTKLKAAWKSFQGWKYSKIALWSAAGVAVAVVALVIVLCAVGPKGNDNPTLPTGGSSMDGTNPTGGENNNGGNTNNGGSTNNGDSSNNGGSTDNGGSTNNGGSANNGGSTNNGSSSNNGGGSTKPTVPENDNTNSSAPPAPEGTVDQMEKVVAVKTSTAGGAITAHPGGRITYTISITNNNKDAIGVTVTDTLPEGTSLVRGCDTVSGKTMTWKVNSIAAGATHKIIYTVKPEYSVQQVRDSKTDIIIKNTAAKVQDKAVAAPAKDIWVLETFNDTDVRRMETGIDALIAANLNAKNIAGQNFSGATLISQMYGVGFSSGVSVASPTNTLKRVFEIAGNSSASADDQTKAAKLIDMMVPGLYGGTTVPASKDSLYRGDRTKSVTLSDLISGDIIYVGKGSSEKMYIVNGTTLVEVGSDHVVINIDPATILPNLPAADRYVVIRPSINLNTSYSIQEDEYYNDYDKQEYTELEKALIATAEAYWLRGDRTQYSDDNAGHGLFRWETLTRQPEDYTVDQYGYINCAGFTHDIHWATYNYSIKAGSTVLNTTRNLMDTAAAGWNAETMTGTYKSTIFYYECPTTADASGNVKSTLTDTEKDAVYKQFVSLLRPGDLIVYRYAAETNGHVMLYVGRGLIIHSTGGSYPSGKTFDSHEATIRSKNVDDLFDESIGETIFEKARFGIVRPQNLTTPKITENTKNRVANMQGIVAEKVSSTAMGKTVNPGDEITYTFYVYNTNNTTKTVAIKDVLSQHVTFVSATNSGSVSGSNISWNLNVPANTRISVSYKVKVNAGVATYTAIDGSKATINGVVHKCLDTYVANTLTAAQQQTIINAVKSLSGSSKKNLELANEIYKVALGVDKVFEHTTLSTFHSQLVVNKALADNTYGNMVAPGLYGGRNFTCSDSGKYGELTRLPREHHLMIGDILFARTSSSNGVYIYLGDGVLWSLSTNKADTIDANARLERAYGYKNYWAILRPSMVLGG